MRTSITLWWALLLLVLGVLAQDVGLDLDGTIDSATTADDTLFNSGGSISVNGFTVTVPKNLQVGFPATWVPWRDFVNAWKYGKFPGFEVSVSHSPSPYIPFPHWAMSRINTVPLRIVVET